MDLSNIIKEDYLKKFKIKKPAKNEKRKELIARLSEITGWSKKSIHFQTLNFPDDWLQNIIDYCQHYSNPKLRNLKLKEFITNSKQ